MCSQDDYDPDRHPNSSSLFLYGADGTWEMYGYSIQTDPPIQDKSTITYHFYMHRRSSFYVITFIAPVSGENEWQFFFFQISDLSIYCISISFVHMSLNDKFYINYYNCEKYLKNLTKILTKG